mgnify:CR=1 FL=1
MTGLILQALPKKIDHKNFEGRTPMDYAAEHPHILKKIKEFIRQRNAASERTISRISGRLSSMDGQDATTT